MSSSGQTERTFIVMRKRGDFPWETIREQSSVESAIGAITADQAALVDESERPDCPTFLYRVAMIVCEAKAEPVQDGKREIRSVIRRV